MQKIKCAIAGQDFSTFKYGFDEADDRCASLKNSILQQISLLYEKGVRSFLSDCSLGVSMWTAEIVAGLKSLHPDIELVCVIPYEEQAAKWHKEYRERYFFLQENCTESILLSTSYTTNCLVDSCRYLVDESDILIAVCDSNDIGFDKIGFMVSYAKNLNRSIIYINPDTMAVTQSIPAI